MDELIAAARAVRHHAYAPYSKFLVGSAVRAGSGKVYAGANVENASYGLALCAERSAIAAAVAAGETRVEALAVVTVTAPPAAPCGMCRQVLAEFAGDALPIALVNEAGGREDTTLGALLPHAFRRDDLG
jgi:cytidine deaminase